MKAVLRHRTAWFITLMCGATAGIVQTGCGEEHGLASCPSTGGQFFFAQKTYSYPESTRAARIVVSRTRSCDAAWVSVTSCEGGTATLGTDLAPLDTVVVFPPGTISQAVLLSLVDDTLHEPTEALVVILSQPSPGYATTAPDSTTVYIQDSMGPPRFGFRSPVLRVVEADTWCEVVVSRSPIGDSAFVTLVASGGTATPGVDYTRLTRTLTFSAQDSTQDTELQVMGDDVPEDTEMIELRLVDPSPGYAVPDTPGVVLIYDDEPRSPMTEITVPLQVGNRWFYDAHGEYCDEGRWHTWDGTLEHWIQRDIVVANLAYAELRMSAFDTLAALDLRQEGQVLYFAPPGAETDSSLAATLPWRLIDFTEGPGSVDTLFAAWSGIRDPYVLWTAQNLGRSAVWVPAGIFPDVHVVSLAYRRLDPHGRPVCYSNQRICCIADGIGIVKLTEATSWYMAPGSFHGEFVGSLASCEVGSGTHAQ